MEFKEKRRCVEFMTYIPESNIIDLDEVCSSPPASPTDEEDVDA